MIYTHENIKKDQRLETDVCIVGSGAGGSAAAYALSKSGFKVIVLEAGSFMTPVQFNQREEQMFPKLFYEAGGRRTTDRAIRVLHGHGVGGSTLHNINLCKRIPDAVIEEWNLRDFSAARFLPYLEQVEKLLRVASIENDQINRANQLFRKGVETLGYRGAVLRHNRQGCVGSGFCELGCAFDAKMNALRVLIPEAVRAGTEVYANTKAQRLHLKNGRAEKLEATVSAPGGNSAPATLTIHARVFLCAGGAIETPAFLQRSSIPDPNGLIGSRLHLHPGVVAAGVFGEAIHSWQGIPQSYECTEFLNFDKNSERRIWIIGGAAHPAGAASLLPGMGAEHEAMMRLYPQFLPLSAMVHDQTQGSIQARRDGSVSIDYSLGDSDRRQLGMGLQESARILFAAGAREVVIPYTDPLTIRSVQELKSATFEVKNLDIGIISVHPMSSVWMGNSPEDSCLDPTGRYHHLENLYVADASVYPTSLGVPPQVSTYAIGLYVADQVRARP